MKIQAYRKLLNVVSPIVMQSAISRLLTVLFVSLVIPSLALYAPCASAGVGAAPPIQIDDLSDQLTVQCCAGYLSPDSTVSISGESVDIHAVFAAPFVPVGQSFTNNFNFFELGNPGSLSDTVSVAMSGAMSAIGLAQTIYDIHFRSDVDGVPLTPLLNAFTVVESGSFQNLALVPGATLSQFGLINFTIRSDISDLQLPEPASIALFGLGLAGLGVWRRRHPRKNGIESTTTTLR